MNTHLKYQAQVMDPVRPNADASSQVMVGNQAVIREELLEIKGFEEEEELEEAEVMKRKSEVRAPSREEIRCHRITHLPFRSWCAECVAGRANDEAHHKKRMEEDTEQSLKEVHFDYMMMRNEEGGQIAPVIVGRCRTSKLIIAHVTAHKRGQK